MTGDGDPRRRLVALIVAVALGTQLGAAAIFAVRASGKDAQSWQLRIGVVGGSFAAGSQNRVVWPTLLAQRTGWAVSNFALPDAGFRADGRGGHAYSYQVDRALASNPDIVVIASGDADNDQADMGAVKMGALDAINKVTRSGRRTLVIGPTWYSTPIPEQVRRISAAVHEVAEQTRTPFLDAIEPPWLTQDEMQPDLSAPTDVGQSMIADHVAAWLRTEVAA